MSDVPQTSETPVSESQSRNRFPKWLKVTLISVGSLLGIVLIMFVVALYLIFTPARLTSIVNKLSNQYLLCESSFEKVDLTLFKTFPNAGLEIQNVALVNPYDVHGPWVNSGKKDTIASMQSLVVGVNVWDYLKHGDIKVEQVLIDHIKAEYYVAPDGTTNFDIFPTSSDTTETESTFTLPDTLDLKKISISNMTLAYVDNKDSAYARLVDVDLSIKGNCYRQKADAKLDFDCKHILFSTTSLSFGISNMLFDAKAAGTLDSLAGKVVLSAEPLHLGMGDGRVFLDGSQSYPLRVKMPFSANLNAMNFSLQEASLNLAGIILNLSGDACLADDARPFTVDMAFSTNACKVGEVLEKWPSTIDNPLPKGMKVDARFSLEGTAQGTLTDTTMPLVVANLMLKDGTFAYKEAIPYVLNKINAHAEARLNLSQGGKSSAVVHELTAHTGKNDLALTGTIDDLLGVMYADMNLKGNLNLPDVKPFLPDSLNLDAKGKAKLDINAKATLEQITAVDLKNMKIKGRLNVRNLDVNLDNDIFATSPNLDMAIQIPAKKHTNSFKEMLSAKIVGGALHAEVVSSDIVADLTSADVEAGISDVMDSTLPFMLAAKFKVDKFSATMDSMSATLTEPAGTFEMVPDRKDPAKVKYKVDYSNSALFAKISDSLSLDFAGLSIRGTADYDSLRSNVLQQWSPNLDIDLKRAYVNFSQLNYMVQVPDIKFNYKPELCEIASANVVFGNSDFYLSGAVTGLEKWISHEDMLRGDLYFTSNYTNVDDLLEALSGLGTDPDTLAQQRKEDKVSKEANPFIVPKDVDFTLHTRIKDCTAYGNDLQELAGDVKVRDGVAVLDQVGFVCKAATMQLTALYKTPRVNHIFLGLDFHLLDIGVHELIDMIPAVDTLVPMLSAFDGNADFHLCAETYVDAFYQPKYSTLRGAAAITGDSLVVLDSETFNKISKLMMFNKKTKNVIDSLDVEMAVFKKEVEVYPFLLSMDKYQVVVAGRHSLEMDYDYHLEIIHSPLPARLAVDALGVMPQVGIKLGKCKYADLYKPEKRNDLEKQTMALKQLIRQSLEANVREETRKYQGLD